MGLAKPGGRRQVFAEALVNIGFQGIKEAMTQAGGFTRALSGIERAMRSTVAGANSFDWATVRLSDTQAHYVSRILKSDYLMTKYAGTIEALRQGELKLTDLNEDQIETLQAAFNLRKQLLNQSEITNKLNAAQLDDLVKEQAELGDVIHKHERLEDAISSLDQATHKAHGVFSRLFGGISSGSEDANKIFGAIRESLEFLGPAVDKLKKKLVEGLLDQMSNINQSDDITSRLQEMVSRLSNGPSEEIQLKERVTTAVRESDLGAMTAEPSVVESPSLNVDPSNLTEQVSQVSDVMGMAGIDLNKAVKASSVDMAPLAQGATKAIGPVSGLGAAAGGTAESLAATAPAAQGAAGGMGALSAGAVATGGALLVVAAAAAATYTAFKLLAEGIQLNIKNMEEFRRTGYRAAGSIRELINTSADLSVALGVTLSDTIETTRALARAGLQVRSLGEDIVSLELGVLKGQRALLELGKINRQFADATGASAESVALLQKRLVSMQASLEDQQAIFGLLALGAARYGLTAEDLNSIIVTLTKNSVALETVWTGTDITSYTMEITRLAGAAKHLGIDMAIVSRIMDDLNSSSEQAIRVAAMGGGLSAFFGNDKEAQLRAMASGAERILATSDKLQGVARARYLERFGGPEYLRSLADYNRKLSNVSEEEIGRGQQIAAARSEITNRFAEASQTLTRAFERISAPIIAMFAKISGPIVDGFVGALLYIEPFISSIVELFVEGIGLIGDIFGPLMPILKFIGKAFFLGTIGTLKIMIDVLVILAKVVRLVFAYTFAPALNLVGGLFENLGTVIDWIGSKINQFFSWIKGGLDSIWTPVSAAIGQFTDWFGVVTRLKEFMFGSSMLHIKEGINELLPSISGLYSAFETMATPLRWLKEVIASVFTKTQEFVQLLMDPIALVKNAMQALRDSLDIEGQINFAVKVPKLEPIAQEMRLREPETNDSMEVREVAQLYTVKFTDDTDKEQLENTSAMATNLNHIAALMRILTGKEDANTRRTADALERLLELIDADKSSGRELDYGRAKSGFGERINKWW